MSTKLNIIVDQGADFFQDIEINDENNDPLDVTGYTANAQMRKDYQSTNSVSFTCTLSNGHLSLILTPNDTINIAPGRYVYDAKLTKTTGEGENAVVDAYRIIEGLATVKPAVTR